MVKFFIRSMLFNIGFYGATALISFGLCWTCFLPRRLALRVAHLWNDSAYVVETNILGLDYELKGIETLPKNGCYIIAAKHQSAWETVKLHRIFGDPAIVLKKELLSIPFLGWFFRKLDMVAVDRSRGVKALGIMEKSALKVKEQGRPIIIFPQGTRVPVRRKMSYKYGVIRLYEMLNVPIYPVALNSGVFWPKNSFYKHPGTITVEVLPPIMPGLHGAEALKQLQHALETRSDELCENAIRTIPVQMHSIMRIPEKLPLPPEDKTESKTENGETT